MKRTLTLKMQNIYYIVNSSLYHTSICYTQSVLMKFIHEFSDMCKEYSKFYNRLLMDFNVSKTKWLITKVCFLMQMWVH